MATLSLRDLPDALHDKLRQRAARHGRSLNAEARQVLVEAVRDAPAKRHQTDFVEQVREAQEIFAPYRSTKVLASDELIAERRLEAWRETVETHRWLNEHGGFKHGPTGNSRS